ncbi:heme NO-binding domain-containing protein [Pedococcus soli]
MKGIIFNQIEDAVVSNHGEDAWDDLVDAADVQGAYTALGNYPDEDLTKLVVAGSVALDTPPDALTRALGRDALLGLAERYPQFFEPHTNVRSFVLTLNDVIHAEVRKLHADSSPPEFWFDDPDAQPLHIHYRSDRQLCSLAEGMLAGAGEYYGQEVTIRHEACMLQGRDHCTFAVDIESVA